MPKVNTTDRTEDNQRVEVSWKADATDIDGSPGHVQIASVNEDSPLELDGQPFTGWRVTLDGPADIRRVIKALQRAERQAFLTGLR